LPVFQTHVPIHHSNTGRAKNKKNFQPKKNFLSKEKKLMHLFQKYKPEKRGGPGKS